MVSKLLEIRDSIFNVFSKYLYLWSSRWVLSPWEMTVKKRNKNPYHHGAYILAGSFHLYHLYFSHSALNFVRFQFLLKAVRFGG